MEQDHGDKGRLAAGKWVFADKGKTRTQITIARAGKVKKEAFSARAEEGQVKVIGIIQGIKNIKI